MAFSSTTVSVGDPTEKADYDRLMDNTIYLKDGATEFTGEKTFQSGTVFVQSPDWRDAGEEIDHIGVSATASVLALRKKVMEIGDWDMSGTQSVVIAHGLTDFYIREISVVIRSDANTTYTNLLSHGQTFTGSVEWGTGDITLARVAGGYYHSSAYDNPTGFNRGWMTIWYEDP